MKYSIMIIAAIAAFVLGGCSTYESSADKRTTTTNYDVATGKVASVIVSEEGVKESKEITDGAAMSESLRIGDAGNAVDRGFELTDFNLGFYDYGLKWFSLNFNSTKAPATAAASNTVVDSFATNAKAKKTEIQTGSLGVNTTVATSTADAKKTTATDSSTASK